jgi:peptidyl-prolyl cis-trans isomerase C
MITVSIRHAVALACALALAGPALAQQAKSGAAAAGKPTTVNGVVIPDSSIDLIVQMQVKQGVPDSPQLRSAVRDSLVVTELLVQDATRKGIPKRPEVQTQLDLARSQIISRAYRDDFTKTHPVTDAELKAEYDRIRAGVGDKEYKARHILVDNEDEAKAIIVKLKKGEKFEDLAKASKDPGSKDNGGELEWNSPAGYVKPFADAMVKLQKGKYTEQPVQSRFGWHVILLEDVRPVKFPALAEVKPQLTERIQQQELEKQIAALRAKAKIVE